MSAAPIDFYFDFSSPYGYFAATRIEAVAQKHGRWVNWQPILLGTVFKITGGQPLPSLPLKGDYAKRDMARSARLLDIPFNYPTKFPISGVAPSRAMTWLHGKDQQKAKDLGRLIGQSPEYQALKRSSEALNEDRDAARQ